MASSKQLIKNAPLEAVYKFVNDSTAATFTITMAELATAYQTIVGTPKASISCMSFCTTASIKISRNGTLLYYLTGDSELPMAYGADSTLADQTITVEITSGTLVLRLLKGEQYKQSV